MRWSVSPSPLPQNNGLFPLFFRPISMLKTSNAFASHLIGTCECPWAAVVSHENKKKIVYLQLFLSCLSAKLRKRFLFLGAVPILTLNLQVGCDGEIPDAWHHQMVFGVSPRGVYLCNPVECVPETILWPRLTSPSVLLVRTRDILSRFTATTDLTPLMAVPDRRFHTFNVLGKLIMLCSKVAS